MGFFLVTNNPRVAQMYPDLDVRMLQGSVFNIFLRVRDFIHLGHRLLTHPLSGSLKPGRIPYKTVFLTTKRAGLNVSSLLHIEKSIEAYHKTAPGFPLNRTEQLLADYAVIDLSHVEAALESMQYMPEVRKESEPVRFNHHRGRAGRSHRGSVCFTGKTEDPAD